MVSSCFNLFSGGFGGSGGLTPFRHFFSLDSNLQQGTWMHWGFKILLDAWAELFGIDSVISLMYFLIAYKYDLCPSFISLIALFTVLDVEGWYVDFLLSCFLWLEQQNGFRYPPFQIIEILIHWFISKKYCFWHQFNWPFVKLRFTAIVHKLFFIAYNIYLR